MISDEENTAIIATKKFLQHPSFKQKWNDKFAISIRIQKRIPMSSGLGGGSADASSTLLLLQKLFHNPLMAEELKYLALEIGADVPFMLSQYEAASVSGVGDRIERIDLPFSIYNKLLIVNSGKGIEAREVYRNFAEISGKKKFSKIKNLELPKSLISIEKGRNDLEYSVCQIDPELEEMLALIRTQYGCEFSRVSGSGGTCFGIFQDKKSLIEAARQIQTQHPDWYVKNL